MGFFTYNLGASESFEKLGINIKDVDDAIKNVLADMNINGGIFQGHTYMEYDVDDVLHDYRVRSIKPSEMEYDTYFNLIKGAFDAFGGITRRIQYRKHEIAKAEIDRLSKYIIKEE